MAVYGISDLHLSFGSNKPMNVFGNVWIDYEEKLKNNWIKNVKEDDYVIIAGDISWATYLEDSLEDFKYINSLPGNKIILKGNHDYYFDTKTKLKEFFKSNDLNKIEVLHNNAIDTEEYIICGTRGWGDTENSHKDDEKLIKRESLRLKMSLDEATNLKKKYEEDGINKKIIVAMHFPPFYADFQEVLEKYDVYKCIYGHLHGYGHTKIKEGIINKIDYIMVSCDYTNFNVVKL